MQTIESKLSEMWDLMTYFDKKLGDYSTTTTEYKLELAVGMLREILGYLEGMSVGIKINTQQIIWPKD